MCFNDQQSLILPRSSSLVIWVILRNQFYCISIGTMSNIINRTDPVAVSSTVLLQNIYSNIHCEFYLQNCCLFFQENVSQKHFSPTFNVLTCSQHSIHMSCPLQQPTYRNSLRLLCSVSVH